MSRKKFLSNTVTNASDLSLLNYPNEDKSYLNYFSNDLGSFYNQTYGITDYEKEENRFYGKKIPEMIFISWPNTK